MENTIKVRTTVLWLMCLFSIVLRCRGEREYSRDNVSTMPKLAMIDNITLDDIFISVKTTFKNHDKRLLVILRTWHRLAKKQTWFFTDRNDMMIEKFTDNHLVNTGCPSTHERYDLCCKTNVEYNHYYRSCKKWFCHFDDDVFVNIPRLVTVLQAYDHKKDWYFGKHPHGNKPQTAVIQFDKSAANISYRYATGAAYCISGSLARKMEPYLRNSEFPKLCQKTMFVDDQAIGYIADVLLNATLTELPEMHSHVEVMSKLDWKTFNDTITLSYSPNNVIRLPQNLRNDNTRFLALFSLLYNEKVTNIQALQGTKEHYRLSSGPSNRTKKHYRLSSGPSNRTKKHYRLSSGPSNRTKKRLRASNRRKMLRKPYNPF